MGTPLTTLASAVRDFSPLWRAAVITVALLATDAYAQTCSTVPNLFIVQDRSGSMTGSPDPANCSSCASKWSMARTAVSNMTSQYANQFKFGLAMYPGASSSNSCATGGTVAAIGTPPATINTIYSQTNPWGGTPTAASLDAARLYLQSQTLTAPTHVMLITDGMPNCNPAIGTSSLDDAATRAAAQNLKNAGFKVYVVGFGSGTTAANNKAVLDGIAAAGGTTSAYTASDQASLSNALSAIAGQVTTCCTNQCTSGATMCLASGEKQSCAVQANGCTGWTTQSCSAYNTCQGGSCVPCQNECTLGALKCEGRASYKCVEGPSRCTVWERVAACQQGQACANNTCERCVACTAGAARCNGKTAETCTADEFGCTRWQPHQSCTSFCSGGVCGACGPSCTVGSKRCNGDTVETCALDSNGCTAYAPTQSCAGAQACGGGGECLDKCTIGELAVCERPGFICQPTANGGGICVPGGDVPGPVVTEPDAGEQPAAEAPAPTTGRSGNTGESFDAVSSGCSVSASPSLLLLAAFVLGAVRRRRARPEAEGRVSRTSPADKTSRRAHP